MSPTLFYSSPFFLYISLCPTTFILFVLQRTTRSPQYLASVKTADFYATLMFGVFMTLAGIFGLVAESARPAARWWLSAAFAMQTLATLIAQLAMIQLLTPDYLFRLLSITPPSNGVPSWRIYALIIVSVSTCLSSLISVFALAQVPSLPSSLPCLISTCLPLPLLLSLARIVKSARLESQREDPTIIVYANSSLKSADPELGLTGLDDSLPVTLCFPRLWQFASALQGVAAVAAAGQVIEGSLGRQVPELRLLTAIGLVFWGGGIMTIHFVIINEPVHQPPAFPTINTGVPHSLERVAAQPSEDCMTLKDPFASPTQVGLPLPPSPSAPRRKPRRRASEPLQLTRFGSFAGVEEDVKEKQAGTEVDQDTQFLEALARHVFKAERISSDSARDELCGGPAIGSGRTTEITGVNAFADIPCISSSTPGAIASSGSSTPTIRQGSIIVPEAIIVPTLPRHHFRLPTESHPTCGPSSPRRPFSFSELPYSPSPPFGASVCSLPLHSITSACKSGSSTSLCDSDSETSFVSLPQTPTLSPSPHNVRSMLLALPGPLLNLPPARRRESP